MYAIVLTRRYVSEDLARKIKKAIENEWLSTERATLKLEADKNSLKIEIDAKDITALKAAVNTVIRYLKTSEDIVLSDI